ncbi:hypothetical protein ACLOJK_036805 [Asimina triloba]
MVIKIAPHLMIVINAFPAGISQCLEIEDLNLYLLADTSIGVKFFRSLFPSFVNSPYPSIARGLDKLQESMDRFLEQYNSESVRKTMLHQEETFRKQVKELHQLYKVQKILMAELGIKQQKLYSPAGSDYKDRKARFWSPSRPQSSPSYFSNRHDHPVTGSTIDYNFYQLYNIRPDQSSQEVSSCPVDTPMVHRGFDLGQPNGVDNSIQVGAARDQASHLRWYTKDKMAIPSSNDLHFRADEASHVELTLSIGCSELNTDESRQPSSSAHK